MRLALSRFVESDLDDIAAYIAADSPRRAVTFVREIRAKFAEIQRNPLLYQLRPDIGPTARLAVHGRYGILYQVLGDVVRIERIVGGGRDLSQLLDP